MTKYQCTVIFDASASVEVEADTPEDAAIQAEEMTSGRQHLCHQCSNDLSTGGSIGVHVYNDECTEQLLDTTYKGMPPQFPTMLRKMWSGTEVQEWINENWNKP